MKILLICGGGASSGFLAQQMRRAAKKKGIDADVQATSYSILEDYIDDVDCLLIGPHLKFDEESISGICKENGVPYGFIEQNVYASLNGEAAFDQALSLVNNK